MLDIPYYNCSIYNSLSDSSRIEQLSHTHEHKSSFSSTKTKENLTNLMKQNPFWEINSHSATQETSAAGITEFARVRHRSLSWARWI
jgi:hypothetical protein